MTHTHILKPTTDKLADTLDLALQEYETDDYELHHTGGRDWVIILRHCHDGDVQHPDLGRGNAVRRHVQR